MKPYQLINLSTQIPIDKKFARHLAKITVTGSLDFLFETRSQRPDGSKGVDIFFVDESDMKPLTERMDGIDRLGVYIDHHQPYHREAIFICPERILKAAGSFQQQCGISTNFEATYRAILLNVVLHELGHALMANDNQCFDHRLNWQQACKVSPFPATQGHVTGYEDVLYSTPDGRIVEESLATAFSLIHFSQLEKIVLENFVASQPQEYKLGLHWTLKANQILTTMAKWRDCKNTNGQEVFELNGLCGKGHPLPLTRIVTELNDKKIVDSVDFNNELRDFHAKHRARWENVIRKNLKGYDGTSLHDIHNIYKHHQGLFDMSESKIERAIFGIFRIDGITGFWHDDPVIRKILNKYISAPESDFEAQEELIGAGFGELASA